MNEAFKGTLAALDALQKYFNDTTIGESLLTDSLGHQNPEMYPVDFEEIVMFTKRRILRYGAITLTESETADVGFLALRINSVASVIAPNLFNSNGVQAIPSFVSTFSYINLFLDELFSYERLDKANLIPKTMSRKIKSLDVRINELSPEIDGLGDKIKAINDAHVAAENIPIDLQQLRKYNGEASELKDKIQKIHFGIEGLEAEGSKQLKLLVDKEVKAEKYLSLCEEAIRASTSKGLAGAFEIKAQNLNMTILAWVAGLLAALGFGGWIGFERLKVLSKVLESGNPSTAVIITQLVLSIFSVGAPLWFAWISTKQINQRFKLAEDYAFKSAVAKAYEGYKNEAARVSDGEFEKRLFDSALTRLEEAPLRLLSDDEHTTPWAEMLNSKSFQKFLDASIDNVEFVKGLVNKKGLNTKTASNDEAITSDKTKT